MLLKGQQHIPAREPEVIINHAQCVSSLNDRTMARPGLSLAQSQANRKDAQC